MIVNCPVAVLLMIVNCFNVRWAAKVQVVFAFSAVVALFIIIAIGLYAIATGKEAQTERPLH